METHVFPHHGLHGLKNIYESFGGASALAGSGHDIAMARIA